MGLLDRVAETLTMLKGTFGGQGQTDEVPAAAPDLFVDVDARRAQLNELRTALTELATAMSADPGRMVNPGWRGRVEDIRFGATQCARLSRGGFDRAALLDLAAEVRPLYGAGPVPPEYTAYQAAHERVAAAAQALRAPLASEAGPQAPA